MIQHIQKSSSSRVFWTPAFPGDVLQACSLFYHGQEISVAQADLSALPEGAGLYLVDDAVVQVDDPRALAGQAQAGPLVWREGGELHCVIHVEEHPEA